MDNTRYYNFGIIGDWFKRREINKLKKKYGGILNDVLHGDFSRVGELLHQYAPDISRFLFGGSSPAQKSNVLFNWIKSHPGLAATLGLTALNFLGGAGQQNMMGMMMPQMQMQMPFMQQPMMYPYGYGAPMMYPQYMPVSGFGGRNIAQALLPIAAGWGFDKLLNSQNAAEPTEGQSEGLLPKVWNKVQEWLTDTPEDAYRRALEDPAYSGKSKELEAAYMALMENPQYRDNPQLAKTKFLSDIVGLRNPDVAPAADNKTQSVGPNTASPSVDIYDPKSIEAIKREAETGGHDLESLIRAYQGVSSDAAFKGLPPEMRVQLALNQIKAQANSIAKTQEGAPKTGDVSPEVQAAAENAAGLNPGGKPTGFEKGEDALRWLREQKADDKLMGALRDSYTKENIAKITSLTKQAMDEGMTKQNAIKALRSQLVGPLGGINTKADVDSVMSALYDKYGIDPKGKPKIKSPKVTDTNNSTGDSSNSTGLTYTPAKQPKGSTITLKDMVGDIAGGNKGQEPSSSSTFFTPDIINAKNIAGNGSETSTISSGTPSPEVREALDKAADLNKSQSESTPKKQGGWRPLNWIMRKAGLIK